VSDEKTPRGWRLWARLILTATYLAGFAAVLSAATDVHFVQMFAAVAAMAIACCGLSLTWLVLWARRLDSRLGQFTVGSLLFLTLLVSLALSFVSWVASHLDRQIAVASGERFAVAAVISAGFAVPAIPLLVRATESVVWLAALAVRRRRDRRLRAFVGERRQS